jgi:hypothetical protein
MRIARLKLVLAAALAVAGLTSAVAVGAPAGSSPIQKAAQKSATASSVKFDFSLSISGAGASIPKGKLTLGGTGAVDSKHKAADFKLNLGPLAPLLAGVTNGTQVPKSIELVAVSNALYMNYPALAKQLNAPGKSWVKFELSKLPKSATGGVNPSAASSTTPQQALAVLKGALSIHKVGSDAHGTHYHGTVDLQALMKLVPKAQQASTKASLAKAGITKLPFDAWIGKGGYLSRFVTSIAVKATAGQPAVKVGFAVNLHDYNAHVNVSAPPASQTVDGSSLLASLGALTGGGK